MRMAVVTIPRRGRRQHVAIAEGRFVRLSRAAGAVGAGVGAGALAEYLFDPRMGRSRRAQMRDKAARYGRKADRAIDVTSRDMANRGRGLVASARYRTAGEDVDERVLEERVRAELGRYVGHPRSIDVDVADGVVTLKGDILAREERRARRAVKHVPGVRKIEAQWAVHRRPDHVPSLQGPARPKRPRPEPMQRRWSPTTRVVAGAGAIGMWSAAGRFRAPISLCMRVCGAALAARALTNLSIRRLTGIRAGRRAVDVEDAISISAPIERVWDIAGDYTKFPLFMTNVREVHRAAHGPTSHWEIAGPAGVLVRFDADETKRIEGRELAWETVEGELVAHTGAVRLDSEAAGTTRVLVQLTYNPIAGATGHAIATLLGADPARKLSEDLMRLKSALETGRAPADAARAGASP